VARGRARLGVVEVGRRGSERAEVLGGLTEGDDDVVFPSDLVEDGVRVAPRGSASD
jgi:HlyD family secretion protein